MKKIILMAVAVLILVSGVSYAGDTTVFFMAQPIAKENQQFSHTLYGAELKYEDNAKGSISAHYLAEDGTTSANGVYGFEAEIPLTGEWQAGVGMERRRINFNDVTNDYVTGTIKVGFKW